MASGQVLWEDEAVPARGPRRAVSRDEIAAAAIAVADRDGLDGLSMQRVSAEVGLTKMALYRYVSGKVELEAIMVDAAVEEPPAPDELGVTWRDQAEEFVRRLDEIWTRHPWLPWVTTGGRLMGPREVGWSETALRILEPLGLAPDDATVAVSMLFGHLRVAHGTSAAGTQPWVAYATGGSTMRDLIIDHEDRFPALSALLMTAQPHRSSLPRYAFGLRCLLDGLEAASARDER